MLAQRLCRPMAPAFSSRGSSFVCAPVAPVRSVVAAPPAARTAVIVEASKQKLKTRKAAAKRFKVTGSGKVMSRQPGKQHLNEKMSRNKNRDKSNMVLVSPSQMTNVKECLPNANIR